jgi:hypothetical protein
MVFCCPGCLAGGPCTCSYDEDDDADPPPGLPAEDVAADAERLPILFR